MVASTLNHVPKVRNYAGGNESLATVIEIKTPRVTGSPCENLELLLGRMIAPNARIYALALIVGGSGFSHVTVGEDSVAAVQPTVGSPGETVQGFMTILSSPAIQNDLWFTVGLVVAVFVGDKQKVGRRSYPDSAKADL